MKTEKGDETRITLSSSLLAELGAPAFALFAMMYGLVAAALVRGATDRRVVVRAQAAGALAGVAILSLIFLTSLFGSIEMMSVSWPLMLLAGMTCRLANQA
jgi:hypothetical protein